MNSLSLGLRTAGTALRGLVILTVALGIIYPVAVTAVGQLIAPASANGSIINRDGAPVASALIGQSFTDELGTPLPQWFQSRPSAAGKGYDAQASGGANLGPENPELLASITQRRAQIAAFNAVSPASVPADALTASASGLDPHISVAYAQIQMARVAAARGLSTEEVSQLVRSKVQGRDLGYLGEPTVNVVELNLALEKLGR